MTMMNDLGLSDGNQVRNAKNNGWQVLQFRERAWILLDFIQPNLKQVSDCLTGIPDSPYRPIN